MDTEAGLKLQSSVSLLSQGSFFILAVLGLHCFRMGFSLVVRAGAALGCSV